VFCFVYVQLYISTVEQLQFRERHREVEPLNFIRVSRVLIGAARQQLPAACGHAWQQPTRSLCGPLLRFVFCFMLKRLHGERTGSFCCATTPE